MHPVVESKKAEQKELCLRFAVHQILEENPP